MKRLFAIIITGVFLVNFLWASGDGEKNGEMSAVKIWAVEAAEVPVNIDDTIWKVVEKKTGLELEWELVSTLVKDEKFNLLMASNELPDVVAYYEGKGGHSSIEKYGMQGAFLPLEDLIKEYAPNIKEKIFGNEDILDLVTANDGHIYFVPMLSALNAARGWYIRYDWLEKLGLEAPKTTEELYNVLVAFRDRDPNGNGKKDEIPLVARRRGDDWAYNISPLAYAFDADPEWVLRGDKVVYGPSEPQYKDYLSYIQRLYTEKLIDQEILTRPGNVRDEMMGQNRAGVLHDWFASTADLNTKLADKVPGFNLRHFAPPVGTADKPYTRVQMPLVRKDGGWAISSSTKDPVTVIKFMDFIYSPEGIRLTNFGIEGVHYKMVDGRPVYTDFIKNNPDGFGFHESLVRAGCQWKIGMVQDIDYEMQFANPIAAAARLDYMKNYIVPEFPKLRFTEEEEEIITDKYGQLKSFVSEMTARVMIGEISVSEWDNIVKKMKDMGLDDITAIYQRAYDRKYK